MVRVPHKIHRILANQASESDASLKRIVGSKLSRQLHKDLFFDFSEAYSKASVWLTWPSHRTRDARVGPMMFSHCGGRCLHVTKHVYFLPFMLYFK